MHDIEPYYHWRDKYIASDDSRSPFYNRIYDEFKYHNKIYNYFIHPQWDDFGSSTLYGKILFADYEEGTSIIELIGEWNDCLKNDIMYLKQNLMEVLMNNGIKKFVIICDNVLNFHGSDNCYYQELHEELIEDRGWICLINTMHHVYDEMNKSELNYYINFGEHFNDVPWRPLQPKLLVQRVGELVETKIHELY